MILYDEEKEFLKNKHGWFDRLPSYLKDSFNILTIISNCFTVAVIIMHIKDVRAHTPNLATWVAR